MKLELPIRETEKHPDTAYQAYLAEVAPFPALPYPTWLEIEAKELQAGK